MWWNQANCFDWAALTKLTKLPFKSQNRGYMVLRCTSSSAEFMNKQKLLTLTQQNNSVRIRRTIKNTHLTLPFQSYCLDCSQLSSFRCFIIPALWYSLEGWNSFTFLLECLLRGHRGFLSEPGFCVAVCVVQVCPHSIFCLYTSATSEAANLYLWMQQKIVGHIFLFVQTGALLHTEQFCYFTMWEFRSNRATGMEWCRFGGHKKKVYGSF